MEKQAQQFKDFVKSVNWKRVAIIALLVFLGILTINIAAALLIAMSVIPFLPGILQLIGLIVAIRFTYKKLLYAEERAKLWTSIKQSIKDAID